jgi:hypothetical protein
VVGGVVPVVNIPDIKPGELTLSGPVLGDIYLGKITNWNSPAIAALNPQLIGIGDGARPCPCHTTRHAGPHRAVQEVEVMRVEGNRERQSIRP